MTAKKTWCVALSRDLHARAVVAAQQNDMSLARLVAQGVEAVLAGKVPLVIDTASRATGRAARASPPSPWTERLTISADLADRVDRVAVQQGRYRAEVIDEAITRMLDAAEQQS